MKSRTSRILVLIAVVVLVILFFTFGLQKYLTFEYLKSRQMAFENFYAAHRLMIIYMGSYILVTALSLPGATITTLAGGAVFGLWLGLLLVSFASTIGATLAFLVSRFLLKDYVQNKFGDRLKAVNEGVEKDGAFYLFTLRLVPVFPFFVINLAMGLTSIRTSVFYA